MEGFASLLSSASDGVRERGAELHRAGRVRIDVERGPEVVAEVQGSVPYRVRLDALASTSTCTCPAGWDGVVCKHVVAVVLMMAAPIDPAVDPVTRFLADRTTAELMEIIDVHRRSDTRFNERLEAMAMAATGHAPDLKDWKKRVTASFGRGFVDYRAAPAWAGRVLDMLASVSELGAAGHHEDTAVLVEHAHKRAETAINRVDDSDGWITMIANEIGVQHLRACEAGAFTPAALAGRLVKLELSSELDTFHRSALRYRTALGPKGLDQFGKVLEREVPKVRNPGDRWGGGFRIRHARIGLALATDDLDAVVAAIEPFEGPIDYCEVIEAFERAGRFEEALGWADRGLADLAGERWNVGMIDEPRARVLAALGRSDEVSAMRWERFAERPSLETATAWFDAADDKGSAVAAMLDRVRDQLGAPQEPLIRRPAHHPGAYEAVRILMTYGEVDEAWSVALTRGAPHDVWRSLSQARRLDDPDGSAAVLASEIEDFVTSKRGKPAYRKAVKVLAEIRRIGDDAERPDLAQAVIDGVRLRHNNKPSLMAIWPQT